MCSRSLKVLKLAKRYGKGFLMSLLECQVGVIKWQKAEMVE